MRLKLVIQPQKEIKQGYENTKLPDIASEESLQGSETINLFDKEGNLVKGTFEGIEGQMSQYHSQLHLQQGH